MILGASFCFSDGCYTTPEEIAGHAKTYDTMCVIWIVLVTIETALIIFSTYAGSNIVKNILK